MATIRREHEYSLEDGIATVDQSQPRRILGKEAVAAGVALGLIVLLGAFFRFYQLGAHGVGNSYYAAAVKSMLQSWRNFFFVSFEPGGSVTVDKPPVGFWLQAASAQLLGINGFALALPQALAGVLSIPLLFGLVRRQFGTWAGLVAALVLAVTPVTVATERYNTIDGTLVFVLLLAAWAFWHATRSGRLRYLLLGALLVGIGFNVKMLEAYMPLPGFYALYLFGARHSWRKRFLHLAGATAVLLVVSLSWAVAVDMTPPQDRPYVGSSTDNSVIELIVGHNGLARLIPMGRGAAFAPFGGDGQPSQAQQSPVGNGGFNFGPSGRSETGQPGPLRLFNEPLATQVGWLLPLALLGIPLLMLQLGRRWGLSSKQQAMVLWGGWLLPDIAYFSFTRGMFHAYYLIVLGPPLAALVAAAMWAVGRVLQQRRHIGWMLAALVSAIVLAFQAVSLQHYPDYARWIVPLAAAVSLAGVALVAWRPRPWAGKAALTLAVAGLAIAPAVWSGVTTLNYSSDGMAHAGPSAGGFRGAGPFGAQQPAQQQQLLAYLESQSSPNGYLLATDTAMEAAPYVLATGRPVLTFGGFMGTDNVVNAQQLSQMVASGRLRFVLAGPQLARQKPDIAKWLSANASPVAIPGTGQSAGSTSRGIGAGGRFGSSTLYDCRPS